MFLLGHLSDPHLAPLPRPRPRELVSKRLLGYLSWQMSRRRIHLCAVLDTVVADLKAQGPDHIVVTGDLTNISLPDEFARAAEWLAALGRPDEVTAVPGNHDAYVALKEDCGRSLLAPYMRGDGKPEPEGLSFPFVRRRGPLALIGLSSAVPSAPGLAGGRLGARQTEALAGILDRLAAEPVARIVLIHHSPLGAVHSRRKALWDAGALSAVIARCGAELVLHGHNHRFEHAEMAGPAGPVPVFGIPSASALPYKGRPAAHSRLYGFEPAGAGWRVTVGGRGYDPASGKMTALTPFTLTLPAAMKKGP